MNQYIAAYLRLSQDDDNAGESNSIASQRQIIRNHIDSVPEFPGLTVIEFSDDGYSGTNFDRPGVKRLLESVRKGEVCSIIVKDLSRFGRQYLEVSKFIEQIFPCLGVRFIAVNDHYDSHNHIGTTAELDVPVRNIINAIYSRDISKKVKSAKHIQMQNGVFSNAFAPFGYMKDKADRHRLLIDEPAAEIVRRIFALAAEGHSAFQIADRLNSDGVITPAAYKKQNKSKLAVNNSARTFWTNTMVSHILRDERYTGMFIAGQHETMPVGSGKKRRTPPETWIRIPDVLPAIITTELYHSRSANRQKTTGSAKPDRGRILFKKVRCGYCGYTMQYVGKTSKPYYICGTARYTMEHGCGRERFLAQPIIDAVKATVQLQIAVILESEKLSCNRKNEVTKGADNLPPSAKPDHEIKKLQVFKRRLYERYRDGLIDRTLFTDKYETAEHNALLVKQEEQADVLNSAHECLNSFLKEQVMSEPADEMVNELVMAVYMFSSDSIEVQFAFEDKLAAGI